MSLFNWISGAMGSASSWTQPDPLNPVTPGASDIANIEASGKLTGALSVVEVNFDAKLNLTGSITTSGTTALAGGALTIGKTGALSVKGLDLRGGILTQNDGTVAVGAFNEFIAVEPGSLANYTQNNGTHTVAGALSMGNGGTGIFLLNGGTYATNAEYIGQNGSGVFTQSGGTHTVADRIVLGIDQTKGVKPAGEGFYDLTGKGNLSVSTVFIGSDPNCTGTFDYNTQNGDTAHLKISGTVDLPGLIVGGQGIGTFTQGAGTLNTTLAVGFRAGSAGTCNFHGDKLTTLTSISEQIGVAGKGSFDQTDGTNTVTGTGLVLGLSGTGDGSYALRDGHLDAETEIIGGFGFGHVTQENGTNTVTGAGLVVGAGNGGKGGVYDLTLGTLKSTGEAIGEATSGKFNQSGGMNTVMSGRMVVGDAGTGRGDYNLTGGTLLISKGALVLGNAAHSSGDFSVTLTSSASGALTITNGTLIDGNFGKGDFILKSGDVQANLTLGLHKGAYGVVELYSGDLTNAGKDEIVGAGGRGRISQIDGNNSVTGNLILAQGDVAKGSYLLKAGALTVTGGSEVVGDAGEGTFKQSGGTNTTDNMLISHMFGSSGDYQLTGGDLIINAAGLGALTVGSGDGTAGSLSVSNATVHTPILHVDGGTVTDAGTIFVAKTLEMTIGLTTGSVVDLTAGKLAIGALVPGPVGTMVIGALGALTGAGSIKGNVRETADGSVTATGGTLSITGAVIGGGTLTINDGATLALNGADANTVTFGAGHGVLRLGAADKFTGHIKGLSVDDMIDLSGITVVSAELQHGVLTVTDGNSHTYALHVAGALAGNTFTFASDGKDGTNLVLGPKPHPFLPADELVFTSMSVPSHSAADLDPASGLQATQGVPFDAGQDLFWA